MYKDIQFLEIAYLYYLFLKIMQIYKYFTCNELFIDIWNSRIIICSLQSVFV